MGTGLVTAPSAAPQWAPSVTRPAGPQRTGHCGYTGPVHKDSQRPAPDLTRAPRSATVSASEHRREQVRLLGDTPAPRNTASYRLPLASHGVHGDFSAPPTAAHRQAGYTRPHAHICTCTRTHTPTHVYMHAHVHTPPARAPTHAHTHARPQTPTHTHTLSAHMYTSHPHAYPTHSACLHTHARAHPRAHTHTHIHAPWRTPWEGGPRGTAGSRASAAPRFPGWDLPRLTERVAVELALVCPRVPPTCLTPRARLCRFPQRPPLRLSDLGGPTRTGERGHWPRSPASGRQEPIRDASRDTSGGWPQRSPRHCSRPGDKPCSLCRGSGNREGQRQPLTRLCWEAGGKWGGWQGARPRLLGPRLCLAWRPVHRDPAGRQERVGVVLCTQSCL